MKVKNLILSWNAKLAFTALAFGAFFTGCYEETQAPNVVTPPAPKYYIAGLVQDVNGAIISGVNVTATPSTGSAITATTDNSGKYTITISGTPAASYTVNFTKTPYEPANYMTAIDQIETGEKTAIVNAVLKMASPTSMNLKYYVTGTLKDASTLALFPAGVPVDIFLGTATTPTITVQTDSAGSYTQEVAVGNAALAAFANKVRVKVHVQGYTETSKTVVISGLTDPDVDASYTIVDMNMSPLDDPDIKQTEITDPFVADADSIARAAFEKYYSTDGDALEKMIQGLLASGSGFGEPTFSYPAQGDKAVWQDPTTGVVTAITRLMFDKSKDLPNAGTFVVPVPRPSGFVVGGIAITPPSTDAALEAGFTKLVSQALGESQNDLNYFGSSSSVTVTVPTGKVLTGFLITVQLDVEKHGFGYNGYYLKGYSYSYLSVSYEPIFEDATHHSGGFTPTI